MPSWLCPDHVIMTLYKHCQFVWSEFSISNFYKLISPYLNFFDVVSFSATSSTCRGFQHTTDHTLALLYPYTLIRLKITAFLIRILKYLANVSQNFNYYYKYSIIHTHSLDLPGNKDCLFCPNISLSQGKVRDEEEGMEHHLLQVFPRLQFPKTKYPQWKTSG